MTLRYRTPTETFDVSIVREDHCFDRLAPLSDDADMPPPAVVRVTTHGERREHAGVAAAIAALWRALGGKPDGAASVSSAEEVERLRARVAELETALARETDRVLDLQGATPWK